jgi:predicted NUDIX family NTP pyrophosphohydrolase
MVVRVRVRLKSSKGEVVTAALANSGYGAEEPEVVVPTRVAERLGLYPRLPADSEVREYRGVGGVVVNAFSIKGLVSVSLLTGDREVGPAAATVVITPGEDEVILSDRMMDALRIVLLRPGEGVWRLADEGEGSVRRSEGPERW